MVDINVNKNQGLISAIKTKLTAENINASNISWNVWTKILEQVKNENEQNKAEGKELIYRKGSDINGNGKENFVIFQGVIKFSQTLWSNICKLAKGESIDDTPSHNQTVINEDNPNDIALQNRTNTSKAISAIVQNVSNFDLPSSIDKSKINDVILQLSEKGVELPQEAVSVGDMTASLLVDLLKKLMPNASEEEINYYAIKNAAKFVPDDTIGGRKCSDLINDENIIKNMAYGATSEDVKLDTINKLNPNNFINDLNGISEVEPNAEIRQNVEQARDGLVSALRGFTDSQLETLGISHEKRDRLLTYLQNIKYDSKGETMHATGIWICVSPELKDYKNPANMITMLMHEANHCDELFLAKFPEEAEDDNLNYRDSAGNPVNKKITNTKAEERACERLGLLTAAILYPDYSRYGRPASEYIDSKGRPTKALDDDINTWVNGYTNYPENLQGALVVEHMFHPEEIQDISNEQKNQKIHIEPGDILRVNGKDYSIGGDNGIIFSPVDSAPIFQFVRSQEGLNGRVVFDFIKPSQDELVLINKRMGNKDGEPFDYTSGTNGISIELIKKDGSVFKAKLYP